MDAWCLEAREPRSIARTTPSTVTEARLDAERRATIRAACPFRLVVDDDLDQLDREIMVNVASSGSTIFEEGDAADGVAAILEGAVDVLKRGRIIATLGPGSVLGELALFAPSARRAATAKASAPVRMVKWRAEDLQNRLALHERLATAIVADLAYVLAERLERRTQDVMELLDAVGTRLPVAELERFRSRSAE